MIHGWGADLVLMDPQYAPKVLARPRAGEMVSVIDDSVMRADAGLFRRFELMRFWAGRYRFEVILSPDRLHMNDWSYACLGQALAQSIRDAMREAR